ncbi:MAG: hypothetical protein OEY79_02825 [Anaplasmataceae bacterium]|nr:hypothetical protein [Anaplasmataceae bacterium]
MFAVTLDCQWRFKDDAMIAKMHELKENSVLARTTRNALKDIGALFDPKNVG